jgi:hypothetical protein
MSETQSPPLTNFEHHHNHPLHYLKVDFAIVPTAISATPAAIATNG